MPARRRGRVLRPLLSKNAAPWDFMGAPIRSLLARVSEWVRAGSGPCASVWREAASPRTLPGPDQGSSSRTRSLRSASINPASAAGSSSEHREVTAAGGSKAPRRVHVDANHVTARRGPQLALAGQQHFQGLVLVAADQGVLAVGADPSVGAGLAPGAEQPVVAAGSAVFGPSGGLEVPAAESPDNDMDASR
jgi:hypothetical protein